MSLSPDVTLLLLDLWPESRKKQWQCENTKQCFRVLSNDPQ